MTARLGHAPRDVDLAFADRHPALDEERQLERLQSFALLVLDDLVVAVHAGVDERRDVDPLRELGRPQPSGAEIEHPPPRIDRVRSHGHRRPHAAFGDRFGQLLQRRGLELRPRLLRILVDFVQRDRQRRPYLGVNHTGAVYTDNANTRRINGYTTADVAVSYRAGPGLYSFRVRNLIDRLYATYGGRAASQVLIAPLRTFEVSAKFDL